MKKIVMFMLFVLLMTVGQVFAQEATPEPVAGQDGWWKVTEVFGVTDQMKNTWIPNLTATPVQPELWETFPNVPNDNTEANFRVVTITDKKGNQVDTVPDGLEFGQETEIYCQQDVRCDMNVAARQYRLYTGDYDMPAVDEKCEAKDGVGCAISVWNVGDVTAIFENQEFDRGYTLTGRYFNGDLIYIGMNALMSHTTNVMLNMTSDLNQAGQNNAGANCSIPEGCKGVDLRIVVTSGNKVLWKAYTTVNSVEAP